ASAGRERVDHPRGVAHRDVLHRRSHGVGAVERGPPAAQRRAVTVSSEAERQRLVAADEYCRHLLRHYENFTVASRLTPRPLRRDLTRVYAFCRTTDDLGDQSGEPI